MLRKAEPLLAARFVRFVSFDRPDEASRQRTLGEPWPYTEGLTLAEATNELAFVATGMYGHPLLKQNGAPVRLVLPWKYGFKSAKSIVRIELTDRQPATFWNTLAPREYAFVANVDPNVPHPARQPDADACSAAANTVQPCSTTATASGSGVCTGHEDSSVQPNDLPPPHRGQHHRRAHTKPAAGTPKRGCRAR